MIEIQGAHNAAVCYCAALDEMSAEQIKVMCDQEDFAGCKIRIMPDVHAGMGCTIGTTMTIRDKIVPGMVGVDIGCGMETTRLAERTMDFAKLDALIREKIPCGREIRETEHPLAAEADLDGLRCAPHVNLERARRSIGTLGGGNHFIEVDRGTDGALHLVIHSGSRHIGGEVAKYYQEEGFKALCGNARTQISETIARLKAEGRAREIQKTVEELKQRRNPIAKLVHKDLAYVEGQLFGDYIHDMKIIQRFAVLNRLAMTGVITEGMNLCPEESFTTIHNYIDTEAMILRKGAVSARAGEKLLIPINMRYGGLICVGKGNPDWNESAPHGAGRLMSRSKAFVTLSMDEYLACMEGVFSTCVVRDTLDESPMAYKNADEIIAQIAPTADIADRIEPLYNFKAAD
ncbi:MAG: RtcB family protein [Synergistaceae bacterium]|jgi:RNA-splicing ligase RtcB|nr:RtcB family protein [Synergistaceae bacterium]